MGFKKEIQKAGKKVEKVVRKARDDVVNVFKDKGENQRVNEKNSKLHEEVNNLSQEKEACEKKYKEAAEKLENLESCLQQINNYKEEKVIVIGDVDTGN